MRSVRTSRLSLAVALVNGLGQFDASKVKGSQNGVSTRQAFTGLDFGHHVSVDDGRNYGIAYDVGIYTDTLSRFGGGACESTDAFLTGRASGMATLRTTHAFGLADGVNFGTG